MTVKSLNVDAPLPFSRIREAVGEFVGLSETPAEPSGEGGTGRGSGTWSDRRLQYFNRKFKLSKDFVQSCGELILTLLLTLFANLAINM